jgi:uncharacterized protein (DUF2062 family)
VRQFFDRRLLRPLQAQLTQGVTPSRLALALALGLVVGIMPMLGITTVLCALLALGLRLNQPAIQLANYVAYPLQLLLFIPFFQAGARLFGRPPITFAFAELQAGLASDPTGTIGRYLFDNLRGVAAWGLAAPLLGALLYLLGRALLSRLPLPREGQPGPPGQSGPG